MEDRHDSTTGQRPRQMPTKNDRDKKRLQQARAQVNGSNMKKDCEHFVREMHRNVHSAQKPWKNYLALSEEWGCPLRAVDGLHLYLRERSDKMKKARGSAVAAWGPALEPAASEINLAGPQAGPQAGPTNLTSLSSPVGLSTGPGGIDNPLPLALPRAEYNMEHDHDAQHELPFFKFGHLNASESDSAYSGAMVVDKDSESLAALTSTSLTQNPSPSQIQTSQWMQPLAQDFDLEPENYLDSQPANGWKSQLDPLAELHWQVDTVADITQTQAWVTGMLQDLETSGLDHNGIYGLAEATVTEPVTILRLPVSLSEGEPEATNDCDSAKRENGTRFTDLCKDLTLTGLDPEDFVKKFFN